MKHFLKNPIALICLWAVTLLVFSPSLYNGFINWDDYQTAVWKPETAIRPTTGNGRSTVISLLTLLRDGSLETRNGNSTNDGKWTLNGNILTLAPTSEPKQTFAIVKVDAGHLTLKATGSERVVEWKKSGAATAEGSFSRGKSQGTLASRACGVTLGGTHYDAELLGAAICKNS